MDAKQVILSSLGRLGISHEKVEELVEELVERGELTRRDSRKFIRQIMEQAIGEREELRKVVEEILRDAAGSIGVATRGELDELNSRLDAIESRIKKIRAADAAPSKPAAKKSAVKKPAAKKKKPAPKRKAK